MGTNCGKQEILIGYMEKKIPIGVVKHWHSDPEKLWDVQSIDKLLSDLI